jgi:predicted Zn-dependent protease with MMP-like domain
MRVSRAQFEKMVASSAATIIRSLPDDLRERARQVIIAAAERPSREQEESAEEGEGELLGLYEGTPLVERRIDDAYSGPDRITLFRIPLLDMCASMKELREEIRITIIHELGHYFGFDEGELARRGLG